LPRELRQIALSGVVWIDLRAAQLAIAARLWDLPEIAGYLGTNQSVWQSFYCHLEVDADAKPVLKRALYACVYGMRIANLRALEAVMNSAAGMIAWRDDDERYPPAPAVPQ
jgi:hypothetical protein